MNGVIDQFRDGLFLRGHSPAESQVHLQFRQRNGNRVALQIPFLEAMLLLQQLETFRKEAEFVLPTGQP